MSKKKSKLIENKDERRANNRMDIKQDVRYTVLNGKSSVKPTGRGKTIDMSSGGMLISTESPLTEGDQVELAISWPAQLDGVLPLKLVVVGHVVRANETQAAIVLEKHEFKTRGAGAL
jgi:c-di-GMP-binding flagellar brake protein YcgR